MMDKKRFTLTLLVFVLCFTNGLFDESPRLEALEWSSQPRIERPEPLTKAQIVCRLPIEQVKIFPGDASKNPQLVGVYVPKDPPESEGDEDMDEAASADDYLGVGDFYVSSQYIYLIDSGKPSLKCYDHRGNLVWLSKLSNSHEDEEIIGAFGDYCFVRSSSIPSKLRVIHRGQELPGFLDRALQGISNSLSRPIKFRQVWWSSVNHEGGLRCFVKDSDSVYLCTLEGSTGNTIRFTRLHNVPSEELPWANLLDNPHADKVLRVKMIEKGGRLLVEYDGFEGERMESANTRGLAIVEVTPYTGEGVGEPAIRVPSGGLTVIEQELQGSSLSQLDSRGHMYRISQSRYVRYRPLNSLVSLISYEVILEYDLQGRFVGVRAVFDRGPDKSLGYSVDAEGNVYYLQFHADHIAVMKAPPPR